MKWLLAAHIILVVCWFAGLFYLPRLFVYHSTATDTISIERFKTMERRLCYGIMTPAGILTTLSGYGLILTNSAYYFATNWLHVKLILVGLLWVYHLYLMFLVFVFKNNLNKHSQRFYRWLNELPTVFLILIVILAVVKPF